MDALSPIYEARLRGVHPALVKFVRSAHLAGVSFAVVEGVRSYERQLHLFKKGASRTMSSRHLTGHAVDLYPVVNGKVVVSDWDCFHALARDLKAVAKLCGVPVVWGGDWKTFKDGPHWELPRKQFPATKGKGK